MSIFKAKIVRAVGYFNLALFISITICSACVFIVTEAIAKPSSKLTNRCNERFFQTGFFLEDGKRTFDENKFRTFVMRMGTPVYDANKGDTRKKDALSFGTKVMVSDPGEGSSRIRVRKLSDKDIGWVERSDLLCRKYPLNDKESGLLKRVVIRTETAVQGEVAAKKAFHSPDGNCEGGSDACLEVSRFQWYFAYAEEKGYYLLSDAANLGSPDANLLGWLPKDNGIGWNTAVALRPSEDLSSRPGPDGTGEDFLCAFPSIKEVGEKKKCRQILGGRRWYGLNIRLPVLAEHNNIYEVAISSAASTGNFEDALAYANISAMNNIDVFFVIDGTKSMKSVIAAIKGSGSTPGLVDQIRKRLKGKIRQGGRIRFGYRIFRDSTKNGADGTDEGMSLPSDCRSNEHAFINSFMVVKAEDTASDRDFAENLYGGMVRASRDISTCPDHLKLVFVIGDHGYDGRAQKRRKHKSYKTRAIVKRFLKGARLNTQPIVFFIQTPNAANQVRNKRTYNRNYDLFRKQAHEFLRGIYGSMNKGGNLTKISHKDYFYRLPSRQIDKLMIDKVVAPIDAMLQPDIVGRLLTRLKAGQSLVESIKGMRAGGAANVPILYWNVVANSLCRRLGKQCKQKVLEGVFSGFIAKGPDNVHEVLLSQRQLHDWRDLLGKFKSFWSMMRGGKHSRDQLTNTLLESIGSVLKLQIDDSGKTMGEYIQYVGGMPHGAQSKLMAYTPQELRNEKQSPKCEIQHLVNYASKKSDILQIAMDGDKLAIFKEHSLPKTACSGLSKKGSAVPYIPGAPKPRNLNLPDEETDYSFSFSKGNERYYWIPVKYLP